MKYVQLPKTHKADTIAEAMYGREMEYFHYEFDVINFKHVIDNAPEGADMKDIHERIAASLTSMVTVEAVYEALKSQITDQAEHEAAVIRTTKKRQENEIRSDK
tara:strand:- start:1035 stop:1346 length:312 start_codon:yes stop_codon:yes gene_type:complete